MDKQTAFNKVWNTLKARGFTRGGARESNYIDPYDGFQCKYRSPNGPCAAGILIPDDQYKPDFERNSIGVVAPQVPALEGLSESFLNAMQEAHDQGYKPEIMRARLLGVASDYDLEVPRDPS